MAISEACKFEIEEAVDDACELQGITKKEAYDDLQKFYTSIGVPIKAATIKQKYYRAKDKKVTNVTSTTTAVFNATNENIDWAKWSWNPVTGCKHGCEYCYARDIANRFYKEKFEPTFHANRIKAPINTKIPKARLKEPGINNVFVCSMADLFGEWVKQKWIDTILDMVRNTPQWNYIFLTKNPKRYIGIDWPDNAWVGTTIDVQSRIGPAEKAFEQITAKVKFVSCEPLLGELSFSNIGLFDWVIIGGQSRSSKQPAFQPDREWVQSLLNQAWDCGCRTFCKPNLQAAIKEYPKL